MSDGPHRLPPKKEVAIALLEASNSVYVHLDPRKQGVAVPRQFVDKPQLVLQVGLNMPIPIRDLTVDDDGISCTLSFNRSPSYCRMPWSAIYALVAEDGRGMMWPTDIPPEVVAQMQNAAAGAQPKPPQRPRPKLAAVSAPPEEPSTEAEAREPEQAAEQVAEQAAEQAPKPAETKPVVMHVVRSAEKPKEAKPSEAVQAEHKETAPEEEAKAREAKPAEDKPEEAVAKDEKDEKDQPTGDAIQERPSTKPTPAGSRKLKRGELPPYLRVIK